jgi:hypothetical protein
MKLPGLLLKTAGFIVLTEPCIATTAHQLEIQEAFCRLEAQPLLKTVSPVIALPTSMALGPKPPAMKAMPQYSQTKPVTITTLLKLTQPAEATVQTFPRTQPTHLMMI